MLIQLIGCAGAGKDSFAQFVNDFAADPLPNLKYAAPLKLAAEIVFGMNFDLRDVKEIPARVDHVKALTARKALEMLLKVEINPMYPELMSPREYQQYMGKLIRAQNENAFVERLQDEDHGIITDARFPNEVFDCDPDVLIVYIHRPNQTLIDHPSEEMANYLHNEAEEYKQENGFYPTFVSHPEIEGLIDVIYACNLDDLEQQAKTFVKDYNL